MKIFSRISALIVAFLLFCSSSGFADELIRIAAADYPVEENGSYSTLETVSVYLATYFRLPQNYLTKKEAKALGWDTSRGQLWKLTDHGSIGGDRFGNYEGKLPENQWTECDIDYDGDKRNAKRLIFSEDCSLLYYTEDHYESFRQVIVDFSAPKSTVEVFSFEPVSVEKYGEYSTVNEVASYIHSYGELPCNYLTKAEAKELGWSPEKDNLNEIMPGCFIGGDIFGNREKLLPEAEGRLYRECDVNGTNGCRSKERIVYSDDGLVYYSPDTFASFIKLY